MKSIIRYLNAMQQVNMTYQQVAHYYYYFIIIIIILCG